jgi:hypothetical protein
MDELAFVAVDTFGLTLLGEFNEKIEKTIWC